MIDVRPAVVADAYWIASNLRAEDRAEVEAATGRSPLEIVPLSFDLSTQCYAILPDDDVRACALFGVADDPETTGLGLVWLLATDAVFPVRRSVLEIAPSYLDKLSTKYPLGLHNLVDHRNLLHLRWCLKTGFVEIGQVDVDGHMFHHIYRPHPQEKLSV